MSIQRVIDAALELRGRLEEIGLPYCFIGGVAVQRWGEPRLTVDADATVLTGWDHDGPLVDALLASFAGRQPNSRSFALQHRVLLLRASNGTALDVALGAIPFEQRTVERASAWLLPGELTLRTCSAEDPVVHKAFAARERDWVDIDGVLIRQGPAPSRKAKVRRQNAEVRTERKNESSARKLLPTHLDTELVWRELRPLVLLKEEPAILTRLEAMLRKRS